MTCEKVIQKFNVALGEEDGELFAAILWPEGQGDVPFEAPISLAFTGDGFALFNDPEGAWLKFGGVGEQLLAEMAARHVVVLTREGDDYGQFEVNVVAPKD
ncbi:hypothetical protein [Geopseudomonas aromaticivorans]